MYFFLILSSYMNTGVTFNLLMRKKSMENIRRLILEEVFMSDRYMSDGQMYSFLQLFFNTEKISLTRGLDRTVTDYLLLKFIVIPLC